MKTWNAFVLGVCLVIVALLAALLFLQHRQNHALRAANVELGLQSRALEKKLADAADTLEATKRAATESLVLATNALTARITNEPAAAAVQPAGAETVVTTNSVPRPVQARTYLGDKFVGMSWVMPMNVRRDAKTGRIWYDQSVRLPEDARGTLTAYVTNVVEREAPAQSTQYVERNYYVDRSPYYYWWPVATVPPRPPRPNPPTPQPIDPLPPILPPSRPVPPPSKPPGIYVPPGVR
jgi:hypothetical protein